MTLKIKEKSFSVDGSIKYLFQNQKGYLIEGIYFRMPPRKGVPYSIYHMCISTQIGCALGCTFCATGYGGFFDQLTPDEMKQEIDLIREDIIREGREKETAGFCIVLMGMGEPFLNYDNVVCFCYLAQEKFPYLKKIGISTVGIAHRIVDFAEISRSINVVVRMFFSLHSPYNDQRAKIMPITKKYPISSVIEACKSYSLITGTQVTASYLLLRGFNDSDQHAIDFSKLLDPKFFNAKILLYNDIYQPLVKNSHFELEAGIPQSHFQRPSDETAHRFDEILTSYGIDTILQLSQGRDVNGGCGQLVKNIKTRVVLSLIVITLFSAQLLVASEQIPEKFDWHQVIEIPELENHWWQGHQVINFFPKDKDYRSCSEAIAFVAKYLSAAQPLNTDAALLKYGSDQVGIDGMYLEMGSGTGRTINFIAALNSEKIIYGFDSFEGLPEAWERGDSSAPQGTFAFKNRGMFPPVLHNVRLIKGWFKDSLPEFKKNILKDEPIAFLHIDCDIYSSTKSIFDVLGDNIIPGTIIVFDEFYNYPGFENHEFKAFQEFLKRTGKKARYLGFNQYFEQVVVRIE